MSERAFAVSYVLGEWALMCNNALELPNTGVVKILLQVVHNLIVGHDLLTFVIIDGASELEMFFGVLVLLIMILEGFDDAAPVLLAILNFFEKYLSNWIICINDHM